MNTFMQNLLLINISTAVVITAYMLIRKLLKNKVHTKILCMLWIVIFVRMLVPVPIETSFGIVEKQTTQNAFVQAQNIIANDNNTENNGTYTLPESDAETISVNTVPTENMTATDNTAAIETPVQNDTAGHTAATSINLPLLIYILGAVAAALYIAVSNILFVKKINRDKIELSLSSDENQIFVHQNIKPLKVYLIDNLHSPCLLGLIHPIILLNSRAAHDERIRRYSLYHESTHYKHKDNFMLLLGLLACVINWFNPMIWIALMLSKQDREVMCDEHVIQKIGQREAIDYGKSLLYIAKTNPIDF